MRALQFFYYLCGLNLKNVKLESMIHFLEQNFVELVTITSMIYLILAVILFLFKTPDTKVYKTFRRSKSLMAGGMLLISLNIWIWIASFTGSWTEYNNWVPCFDIILFYLMGICFSFSLSSLLDPHYISRKRCKVIAVKFVMTAFFALIAMTDALKDYQIPLLLIALLGLLEMLIGHIYYFNRCYLRSNALFENYFSNDKNHFIRWLKVSHWLFYGMLILGVISIRTGALINWLVQFYVVAMNLYILINIINYASEYETLMKANCDEEKTEEEGEVAEKEKNGEISPKKAYIEKLRPRVAEWILEKSYLEEQFTIDDLSARLYTNKTYLSTFIKEEFGMNFSNWITSLRLKEAKKMMSEHPDARLKDIAYNVGFSSLPYFSSVFAKSEGITPSAWMKERSRNKER